jgi:hypothetical protein
MQRGPATAVKLELFKILNIKMRTSLTIRQKTEEIYGYIQEP